MNVFSAKSIGLYALAIGSAIGFFNLVTSYGEANIRAPQSIAGIYPIVAENLPGCLQRKALLFNIQQSGIYLNAHLNTIDIKNADILDVRVKDRSPAAPSTNPRPAFAGKLQGQKLDLSGSVPIASCPIPSQLRLSGAFATSDDRRPMLQGQLWLTDRTQLQGSPVKFTATQQPSLPATSSH
jgi:hypothetical protein